MGCDEFVTDKQVQERISSNPGLARATSFGPPAKNFLLWLLGELIIGVFFYELLNWLPDSAQVIILLVAIVIIWYRIDFPKRTTDTYATLLFWLPIALGLFCGALWGIIGGEVWVRLGIACIFVRAVYRVYPLPEKLGA